jgi:NAD(P) transhydrogenase
MSASNRYDLVVVGSGPAGEKGAAQAAYFGKRVAIVERAPHLGGAGINTGTVPPRPCASRRSTTPVCASAGSTARTTP